MKKFLTGVLIFVSIVLLFESCSSLRRQGYRKTGAGNFQVTPVFSPGFEKSLYTAEITFGKNSFSSLAVIKQIPEDRSFRLAFISETGMRLFEMEFLKNGAAKVHYMTAFLNRKAVMKKLSSDFNLLFISDGASEISRIFVKDGDAGSYVLRVKKDGKKDFYFSSANNEPGKIKEQGCAFGRTTVELNKFENGGPNEILFTHKMLKLKISLKQINYPEWN
ncbi:MAG: hypothetical protein R2764_21725 [Bacteroidales bacterium]